MAWMRACTACGATTLWLLSGCDVSVSPPPHPGAPVDDPNGVIDGARRDAQMDGPEMDGPQMDAPMSDAGIRDAGRVLPMDAGADAGSDGATSPTDAVDAGERRDAAGASDDECGPARPCEGKDRVCQHGQCEVDGEAPGADVERSAWSARAGWVDARDRTHFCTPTVSEAGRSASSRLVQITSDGTASTLVSEPDGTQRLRLQCQRDAAADDDAIVVTSGWSADADGDALSLACPAEYPHIAGARCQVATTTWPAYVYAGSDCGDGATGLTGKATLEGQLVGDRYELTTASMPKPLFNDTRAAGVIGTDLGFQFLAQGHMYIGFGDTWENDLMLTGPLGDRGSILGYTRDLDASDGDGIVFEGWETAPGSQAAREIIHSEHDYFGPGEVTAIATTGVGLSEGDRSYRIMWFAAIDGWDPFETSSSTLTWSVDGGEFVRGDEDATHHPPRWPHASYFGPGAMWHDRQAGMVYFFGVRTYVPESPIRVARVKATAAALRDHLQYEYWTGSAWQRPDPADEYALAFMDDPAADLIPGSSAQSNRPEIAVAYNAYIGRYVMTLQNDLEPFADDPTSEFQLWQATAPEGPWQQVDTGQDLSLPAGLYGPYTSEHIMRGAGRDVYFVLSEWQLGGLSLFGQPYTVGLWHMGITRSTVPGCRF